MNTESSTLNQAREHFLAGNYHAAEPIYQAALAADRDNPHLLLMTGLCRHGLGDSSEALKLLEQAADLDDDAEAQLFLARVQLDTGQRVEAEQSLKRCLAINPNHAGARTMVGELELHNHRPAAAIQALKAALRIAPDHPPALAALALALVETGQTAQARAYAERALKADPKSLNAQVALARVFQALGHLSFAEQCLRNALDLRPQAIDLIAALGGVVAASGRHAEAVELFNRAIRQGFRTETTLMGAALSLQKLGRFDEAAGLVEQLLAGMPEHFGGRAKLAELYLDRDQADQARQQLAALRSPSQPTAITLLEARLAELEGKLDKAHNLAASLHHDPQASIAERARLLSGRVACARGSAVAARKALMPLIEAGKHEPQASWLLADAIAAGGQIQRAREVLDRLIADEIRSSPLVRAQTSRRLAIMLIQAGEFDAAQAYLEPPGWKTCHYLEQILNNSPAPIFESYLRLDKIDWESFAVEQPRADPVFVLGWPGSGRDLLLAALDSAENTTMLDPANSGRRRTALGIPLKPSQLSDLDEGRFRLGRRRFLSELGASDQRAVDPCWWEAAAVPGLLRYFPGARIVVPRVRSEALELYWRLCGFKSTGQMMAARNEDEELLSHLRSLLPTQFIDLDLDALVDHPQDTLELLEDSLEIRFGANADDKIAQQLADQPYLAARQHPHFADILLSGDSLFGVL